MGSSGLLHDEDNSNNNTNMTVYICLVVSNDNMKNVIQASKSEDDGTSLLSLNHSEP